jgi:hypothetical protein
MREHGPLQELWSPLRGERKRERERGKAEHPWIMFGTWTDWNPSTGLLGTSSLKKGADITFGEWSPRRNRAIGKWRHEQKPLMRQRGKSRIWDSKILSRIPRDSNPRINALARASSNCKWRTILSSERLLYKDYDRRCSIEKNSDRESQTASLKVILTLT